MSPFSQLPLGNALTHEYDSSLKKLTIRGTTQFPTEILDFADDIEILDMPFGSLSTLPDDFGRLKNLRIAFFSYNAFEELPEVLATCSNLSMVGFKSCKISRFSSSCLPLGIEAITLTDNRLETIPASIGDMKNLKKLMLAGNQLKALPRELLECDSLELIRFAANKLTEAPSWLFSLPSLAWYNDMGNAFHNEQLPEKQLPLVPWQDISVGEKIGESSKNAVYRAEMKNGEYVAVKIYGGEVTTDGSPLDEMRAHVAAGSHPNLVRVIAKLTDAPEQKPGLVMSLVPPHFTSLGQPPDLKTHTRDTFTRGQTFTLPFIVAVLQGVGSALAHLHQRGIAHGDVYAHNVLVDKHGQAYLCDFGAASFYDVKMDNHRRERVDVRGFGYLIDDLLVRVGPSTINSDSVVYNHLSNLRHDCLRKIAEDRPLFTSIIGTLQECTHR